MAFKQGFVRKIFSCSAALTSIAFALLTACSGGSSPDPTVVAVEFSAYGVKATINGQNVTLDLSGLGNCATNIESMVVGINANGASISPDPRKARDYSAPVEFTITTPDGTKVVYKVIVKGAACIAGTPTPTPTLTPTPSPKTCTTHTYGTSGYALVFKACDTTTGQNTFYDKTECVRDNATGLIWQGQTPSNTGLRANNQYKTNYDSTSDMQKQNFDGTISVPTQVEIEAITNSIGFKNAINTSKLCGINTWRIPSLVELTSIVKNTEYPSIDNSWFPNTVGIEYWTSSPWNPFPNDARSAYVVNFYGSNASFVFYRSGDIFGIGQPVRLVR